MGCQGRKEGGIEEAERGEMARRWEGFALQNGSAQK